MIVDSSAEDIVLTPYLTGVPANFLLPSIVQAGIDTSLLNQPKGEISFDTDENTLTAWRDIWSAGKGVEHIHEVLPTAALVENLKQEFAA